MVTYRVLRDLNELHRATERWPDIAMSSSKHITASVMLIPSMFQVILIRKVSTRCPVSSECHNSYCSEFSEATKSLPILPKVCEVLLVPWPVVT